MTLVWTEPEIPADIGQGRPELLESTGADDICDLGVEPVADGGGVGHHVSPLSGVPNDLGAPVVWVGDPLDIAELDEFVDELSDGVLGDVLGAGDIGDAAALPSEEDHQPRMRGPQAGMAECVRTFEAGTHHPFTELDGVALQ